MNNRTSLDRLQGVLFGDMDELQLSKDETQMLVRYRAVFTLSLENPSMTDTRLRDYLMNNYGINMSQAYRDLANVRILLGNVQNAGKEWIRYIVNETLKKSIEDAKGMGKTGLKLMIMAADKLGKYNRLDKDDGFEIPWDEIVPQQIEPVTDPSVLGVKKMENKEEEIRKLYEKYKAEIEIEDVDYEPVDR